MYCTYLYCFHRYGGNIRSWATGNVICRPETNRIGNNMHMYNNFYIYLFLDSMNATIVVPYGK